jgi:hypothetical protein
MKLYDLPSRVTGKPKRNKLDIRDTDAAESLSNAKTTTLNMCFPVGGRNFRLVFLLLFYLVLMKHKISKHATSLETR